MEASKERIAIMTEEERQKIILELEQEVLGHKPWNQSPKLKTKKKGNCEVCKEKLVDGDCPEHPPHIRMHQRSLEGRGNFPLTTNQKSDTV